MNLDEALAGAEMAQQYPVAPSMPIQAPSEPPQSSSGSMSQQQTPQSSRQVRPRRYPPPTEQMYDLCVCIAPEGFEGPLEIGNAR